MTPQSSTRPWVSANFALAWDARISTRNRTPSDFSSPEDKRRFLEIRALADAVLVGAATAAADRMTMGLPRPELRAARQARGQPEYPLRVLISNSGRIDPSLPVFAGQFSPILVFSTRQMPLPVREALEAKAQLRLAEGDAVDLPGLLATLAAEHGVKRLHCEGGGRLFHSLAAAGLVDELFLTLCPTIFGGVHAPTLTGEAGPFLPASLHFQIASTEVVESECFLVCRRQP